MTTDQMQLYKTCSKEKHQKFMLVIALGLVAEIISIGYTAEAKAIVEQGLIPSLIALICFAVGLFGIQRVNKRTKQALTGMYGSSKKIVTALNIKWRDTTAEFKGDTTLFHIDEIVGVIDVGDKASLIHWLESDKYSLVQLEYLE